VDQHERIGTYINGDGNVIGHGNIVFVVKNLTIAADLSSSDYLTSPGSSISPLNVPYQQPFVGREHELQVTVEALMLKGQKPIVLIVGLGGIGKTALACEAARICWDKRGFDNVVWISTKREEFVDGAILDLEAFDYSFEELLNELGRELGRQFTLTGMSSREKAEAIRHLLHSRRVLIILDNLETLSDSESMVSKFLTIFSNQSSSKLLITSRYEVKAPDIFAVRLVGLLEQDGLEFLQLYSLERNIDIVTSASKADLLALYRATGGAPLAMKLLVGQLETFPLSQVIEYLQTAKPEGPDYNFYRFVYLESWKLLNGDARKVLIAMAHFVPMIGAQEPWIKITSRLTSSTLDTALLLLKRKSLVEPIGDIRKRRYAIHQLTYYFVRSDILKIWS